jgi:hypothetical protein
METMHIIFGPNSIFLVLAFEFVGGSVGCGIAKLGAAWLRGIGVAQ